MSLLNSGPVQRVRQHHAVEHATITLLMLRNPALQLIGGRSNHRGFFVYGEVDSATLKTAAEEALARLQAGEAELAIHPNCGTNLVVTGTLAGLAALTTTVFGRRQADGKASLADQIPAAILAATAAMLAGRPLGSLLQEKVTTSADVEDLRLGDIDRRKIGRLTQHFVKLETV